jgi:hypothetical protein
MEFVVDTSKYYGMRGVTLHTYADFDESRHLCINAYTSDNVKEPVNDYFYRNIKSAKFYVIDENGTTSCDVWSTDPVYPHNEQKPPYIEGKLFDRWDCEEDLVKKKLIWMTYAQGFDSNNKDYRRVLWAHPHLGKKVRIEYEDVPLNGRLNGFYGINDLAHKRMWKNQITFSTYVDGKKVHTDTVHKVKGWREFTVAEPLPERGNVTFEVTVAGSDKWAHFFLNAFTG